MIALVCDECPRDTRSFAIIVLGHMFRLAQLGLCWLFDALGHCLANVRREFGDEPNCDVLRFLIIPHRQPLWSTQSLRPHPRYAGM